MDWVCKSGLDQRTVTQQGATGRDIAAAARLHLNRKTGLKYGRSNSKEQEWYDLKSLCGHGMLSSMLGPPTYQSRHMPVY